MIFDRLWRAERRDAKALKKLRQKYKVALEAAKGKDYEIQKEELADYSFQRNLIEDADCLRTEILVNSARKLGISIPPQPPFDDDNDDWVRNSTTYSLTLREEAEARLRREVRKEEVAHLQHQMRWVSQVIVPIIGLIGAIMGLISLVHALYKKV